jgi:hypothetical protein
VFEFGHGATFANGVFFPNEPEEDGNLLAIEELAGEGDHTVHEIGLEADGGGGGI